MFGPNPGQHLEHFEFDGNSPLWKVFGDVHVEATLPLGIEQHPDRYGYDPILTQTGHDKVFCLFGNKWSPYYWNNGVVVFPYRTFLI